MNCVWFKTFALNTHTNTCTSRWDSLSEMLKGGSFICLMSVKINFNIWESEETGLRRFQGPFGMGIIGSRKKVHIKSILRMISFLQPLTIQCPTKVSRWKGQRDLSKRLENLTSTSGWSWRLHSILSILSWAHFGYYQKCERAVSELRQSNGNDKINNSIDWRTAEKKLFSLNSSTLDSCFIPQSSASRICKSSPLKSQNCRRISECLPLKRCATEPTLTSRSQYIWSPRDKISNFDGWQRELELGREWFSKSRSQNHPESMRQWQQRQIFNLCAPKRAETFDTDFISRQISTLSLVLKTEEPEYSSILLEDANKRYLLTRLKKKSRLVLIPTQQQRAFW